MATTFAVRAAPPAPACTDPDRDYIFPPDLPQPDSDGPPLIQFPLPEPFDPDLVIPNPPSSVLSGSRRLC